MKVARMDSFTANNLTEAWPYDRWPGSLYKDLSNVHKPACHSMISSWSRDSERANDLIRREGT